MNLHHHLDALTRVVRRFSFPGGEHGGRDIAAQLVPDSWRGDFKTRYVRFAFDDARADGKRRHYWLFWDAETVGGLPAAGQVAAR